MKTTERLGSATSLLFFLTHYERRKNMEKDKSERFEEFMKDLRFFLENASWKDDWGADTICIKTVNEWIDDWFDRLKDE